MRLIDADALKKQMCEECFGGNCGNRCYEWSLMNSTPTVDPVKHGHWIEHDVGLICSECNHYTEAMYDELFNNEFGKGWALKRPYYCGYCGAKMDKTRLIDAERSNCGVNESIPAKGGKNLITAQTSEEWKRRKHEID